MRRSFAHATGSVHSRRDDPCRSRGGFDIFATYISRLKQWMVRIKGVATKHLASYLGWRRMIERDGAEFSPARCMLNALPQPAT